MKKTFTGTYEEALERLFNHLGSEYEKSYYILQTTSVNDIVKAIETKDLRRIAEYALLIGTMQAQIEALNSIVDDDLKLNVPDLAPFYRLLDENK